MFGNFSSFKTPSLKNLKRLKKKKEEEKEKKKTIAQQYQQQQKKNDCKNSKDISGPFSGLVGIVGSLPRQFPLFNFFCLLVSSMSDFRPDMWGGGGGGHMFF